MHELWKILIPTKYNNESTQNNTKTINYFQSFCAKEVKKLKIKESHSN